MSAAKRPRAETEEEEQLHEEQLHDRLAALDGRTTYKWVTIEAYDAAAAAIAPAPDWFDTEEGELRDLVAAMRDRMIAAGAGGPAPDT